MHDVCRSESTPQSQQTSGKCQPGPICHFFCLFPPNPPITGLFLCSIKLVDGFSATFCRCAANNTNGNNTVLVPTC